METDKSDYAKRIEQLDREILETRVESHKQYDELQQTIDFHTRLRKERTRVFNMQSRGLPLDKMVSYLD